MASNEQLRRWCVAVLEMIDAGTYKVDDIIAKQGRMSTLVALESLIASKTIIRCGNLVWRPGQRQFFKRDASSPF